MQIKARLSLQFLLIVSAILLFSFIIVHINTINYRYNEFYDLLENRAGTVSDIYKLFKKTDPELVKEIDKSIQDKIYDESIYIFSNDSVIFRNHNTRDINYNLTDLKKIKSMKSYRYARGEYEMLGQTFTDEGKEYIVLIGGLDRYGIQKVKNRGQTLVIIFFIIVIVVAVSGWFFSSRALVPITRVIEKVEEISPDNLNSRIDKSENEDEIGRLIKTFNNLLDRIEEAFKLQKLFVASASHQLKNPLTVITSQLEVSLINERSNEDYKKIIASVLEDIKDLNVLTLQLMELARISHSLDIPFDKVRLDEILWNTKEYMTNKYPGFQYSFHLSNLPENEEDLCISGNETLLRTAFINLIENAWKFSENKKVIVTLEGTKQSIVVRIRDYGKGIQEDEIDLIFEPFYRGKDNVTIKGHGIGLALVHQIVKIHQASITINKAQGGGSEFVLTFPISTPTHQ